MCISMVQSRLKVKTINANNGSTFEVLGGGATNGDVIEAVAYKAFNVSAIKDAPGDFTVGNQLNCCWSYHCCHSTLYWCCHSI